MLKTLVGVTLSIVFNGGIIENKKIIEDSQGNQFVWVPVDGTNVTYVYHYSIDSTGSISLEQSLPTGISSEDAQITEYSTNDGASWTATSSTTKGTSTSWLLKTGHTDYTSRKNIYDLAGNLWEWTNTKYSSSSSNYVSRGGGYYSNGTILVAAYRSIGSSTDYYGDQRLQSWAFCTVALNVDRI